MHGKTWFIERSGVRIPIFIALHGDNMDVKPSWDGPHHRQLPFSIERALSRENVRLTKPTTADVARLSNYMVIPAAPFIAVLDNSVRSFNEFKALLAQVPGVIISLKPMERSPPPQFITSPPLDIEVEKGKLARLDGKGSLAVATIVVGKTQYRLYIVYGGSSRDWLTELYPYSIQLKIRGATVRLKPRTRHVYVVGVVAVPEDAPPTLHESIERYLQLYFTEDDTLRGRLASVAVA